MPNVLTLAPVVVGPLVNLIANGEFETNLTGWQSIGTGTIARDLTQQHTGLASMSLSTLATNDGVRSLAVAGQLVPAKNYFPRFWVIRTVGSGTMTWQVDIYNSAGGFISTPAAFPFTPTGSWALFGGSFVTPAGADNFVFSIYATSAVAQTVYIDTVSVVPQVVLPAITPSVQTLTAITSPPVLTLTPIP